MIGEEREDGHNVYNVEMNTEGENGERGERKRNRLVEWKRVKQREKNPNDCNF